MPLDPRKPVAGRPSEPAPRFVARPVPQANPASSTGRPPPPPVPPPLLPPPLMRRNNERGLRILLVGMGAVAGIVLTIWGGVRLSHWLLPTVKVHPPTVARNVSVEESIPGLESERADSDAVRRNPGRISPEVAKDEERTRVPTKPDVSLLPPGEAASADSPERPTPQVERSRPKPPEVTPVELPLAPIASLLTGEVHRLDSSAGDVYFWLVAPAGNILQTRPTDMRSLNERNRNRLEIRQAFEMGDEEGATIGEVNVEELRGARRIVLNWNQADPSKRLQIARCVLVAQEMSTAPPTRRPFALCPPVEVPGGRLGFGKPSFSDDFRFVARHSPKPSDGSLVPAQVLSRSWDQLAWDGVELELAERRYAARIDLDSKSGAPGAYRFRSPPLEEALSRMASTALGRQIQVDAQLVLERRQPEDEPRFEVALSLKFSGKSSLNRYELRSGLESIRKSREESKVPADAVDPQREEKKRQAAIQEVTDCLKLMDDLENPGRIRVLFQATEEVGSYRVVRWESAARSPSARPAASGDGKPSKESSRTLK